VQVKLDKKALCSVTAASESELNSIVNDMLVRRPLFWSSYL
jgi:hypothetical protein